MTFFLAFFSNIYYNLYFLYENNIENVCLKIEFFCDLQIHIENCCFSIATIYTQNYFYYNLPIV